MLYQSRDQPYILHMTRCNPQLDTEIARTRSDSAILKRAAELRQDFLQQRDCLCHGDFSCDNIMVCRGQFKVGLRNHHRVANEVPEIATEY